MKKRSGIGGLKVSESEGDEIEDCQTDIIAVPRQNIHLVSPAQAANMMARTHMHPRLRG